jgi:hypothetical protein
MNALLLALLAVVQDRTIEVSAGKHVREPGVVRIPIDAEPGSLAELQPVGGGPVLTAQVSPPSLFSTAKAELVLILPVIPAETTAAFRVSLTKKPAIGFSWHDVVGDHSDLRLAGKSILRYMHRAIDESTKEAREQSYKVYHHVFDPSGERLLTKGPGGRYTHHRGLFYGFKCIYGGKTVDTWHCTGDTHLAHDKLLSITTGPVVGGHRVQIRWHGAGKEVFALEEREIMVYTNALLGGVMIDFSSRLRSTKGTVKVGGDPQHAGFHFRADNEVSAKTAKQTYFLRPDGAGKPGETRNWPALKSHANLPWNAMSFVLGDKRYTVTYLDHPKNPKEARYSERDYGRFGSYFEAEFDETKTLDVRYRLWVQEGEMTGQQVERLSAAFIDPPAVVVK